MKDDVFVDSNILVYAYDKSEGKKHKICKNFLEKVFLGDKRIFLSTQILSEFAFVVTKKIRKPLSNNEVYEILEELTNLENIIVLQISKKTVLNTVKITNNHNLNFWDAQIASTIVENNITKILTENIKDFSKFRSIEAISPFKS